MKVDLHYGKDLLSLQIPESNIKQIIQPWQDEGKADNLAIAVQTLAHNEVTGFQKEIAGKRLCVLT
jgi:hypothetical protein